MVPATLTQTATTLLLAESANTDGSKSRECVAAVLTTFAGQGGICRQARETERGREGKGHGGKKKRGDDD